MKEILLKLNKIGNRAKERKLKKKKERPSKQKNSKKKKRRPKLRKFDLILQI